MIMTEMLKVTGTKSHLKSDGGIEERLFYRRVERSTCGILGKSSHKTLEINNKKTTRYERFHHHPKSTSRNGFEMGSGNI